MKKMNAKLAALAALVAGLGIAGSAHATWTFSSASGAVAADATGVSIVGASGAYAANGGTLTAGALNTAIAAGNTYGINGFASGATWTVGANSALQSYPGLGMASDSTLGTAPNHALDNGPSTNASDLISGLGNTEAVIFQFSSSVVLSSVSVSYTFGDADISVFRYTGSGAPSSLNGVAANGLSGLSGAGWSLVGNYGDLTTASATGINAGNLGSSWWLITAYNSTFGAATTGTVNQGNDFFKISALAGTKCTSTTAGVCGPGTSVPEPASLALVAVAGLGAFGARRRQLKAKKA